MHAARDDGRIVGGAGAFNYRTSVPGGGSVSAGGATVVGVLPIHRRRGVLTGDDEGAARRLPARAATEVAYLWASEATIYGRFGYGLASRIGAIELSRERTRFAQSFEPRGTVRLLELDEASKLLPAPLRRGFAQRPGMFSRNKAWWETRKLNDDPARRRGGPSTERCSSSTASPRAYALYRVAQDWTAGVRAAR